MTYKNIIITYNSTKLLELLYFKNIINTIYYNLTYKKKILSYNNIFTLTNIKKNVNKLSILKSPHVNKTAWHQFKKTNFKQTIIFKKLTYIQIKQLINFLHKNKPININLNIKCIN